MITTRTMDARAAHSFPVTCIEEMCHCGRLAAHKLEETTGREDFHPLTAYLCCACFAEAMGRMSHASYPYPAADVVQGNDPIRIEFAGDLDVKKIADKIMRDDSGLLERLADDD